MQSLRLLAIFAHPDDESLGTGSTLAKYAAEGVDVHLVVATRGEHGWQGDPDANPGPTRLGELRTEEVLRAARALGLREVTFLDYIDGHLDLADPGEVIARIVGQVRRVRPQVVLTFAPDGAYGHPDHIAISQFTTAALVAAADASFGGEKNDPPHRVSKFYYFVESDALLTLYESLFGPLIMTIDDVDRSGVRWPEWAITTVIDADRHWETAWQAVLCHRTQLPSFSMLEDYLEKHHETLLGVRHFYRAYSLVNGGRTLEHDLFEGLR